MAEREDQVEPGVDGDVEGEHQSIHCHLDVWHTRVRLQNMYVISLKIGFEAKLLKNTSQSI